MAPLQNLEYSFPYFPLPPPPPHSVSPPKFAPPHNFPPPSSPFHPAVPPPHHPITPSPAPAPSTPHQAPPPKHPFKPPPPVPKPPSHPSPPPPPHSFSPPPHIAPVPHPPTPPPGHHSTVIVVVFISLGGLFFLTFLSVALCCFIKKRKKRMVTETDIVNIDEHIKVQEAIVPGPHGSQAVILSVEEDVHIQEEIKKNEEVAERHLNSAQDHQGLHISSAKDHLQGLDTTVATSGSNNYHLEHKA